VAAAVQDESCKLLLFVKLSYVDVGLHFSPPQAVFSFVRPSGVTLMHCDCGLVAQRLGRWIQDPKVHGSILSRCTTK